MGIPHWNWPREDPEWLKELDWMMFLIVAVVGIITVVHLVRHRSNIVHEAMQRNYCIIIGLPALTAVLACITLFFPHLDRFIEVLVQAYHVVCVVAFFHVLVEFCGGFDEFTKTLKARDAPLSIFPFPSRCCAAETHEVQITSWKRGIYQVLVSPCWALLYAVLVEVDRNDKFYLNGITHSIIMLHLSCAMCVLLTMYMISKEDEFHGLGVVIKFTAIKLIVVLHVLSKIVCGFVFGGGSSTQTTNGFTPREYTTRQLSRITLLQMVLFAVGFIYVFGPNDSALQLAAQSSTTGTSEQLAPIQGAVAKGSLETEPSTVGESLKANNAPGRCCG
jgi:hypothetical protein